MARITLAALEAVVTAQQNDLDLVTAALKNATALIKEMQRQLAELQLAHLQLGTKAEAIPQVVVDPCSRVQNWKMEYAKYRATTGKNPTADGVREWIRAGRPE